MKPSWATACLILVLCSAVPAQDRRGTPPRQESNRYPFHVNDERLSLGAVLIPADKVRKLFVTDLGQDYLVVEVGVYPGINQSAEVLSTAFTVRIAGTDSASRPANPKIIAAMAQRKAAGQRDITVYPQVGIGYESGRTYDPVTGRERREGGVVTSAGVGVGIDPGQTASTEKDREVMELELTEKSLPEGNTRNPVAGYLYFPLPDKKKKAARYQLEYAAGNMKLSLPLASE